MIRIFLRQEDFNLIAQLQAIRRVQTGVWTVKPGACAPGSFLGGHFDFFFFPFGACAPRKTKVGKVTKQSFRRMPIPNLFKPGGVHCGEGGVV